jgi:acyl-CoA thioesterase
VLSEDWAQGRSIFGGMQAAVGLVAMRKILPANPPLRTLQVTFVGPIAPGAVSIEARVLRAGRNVIHAEARLQQASATQCIVTGVFGEGRESAVSVELARPDESDARAFDVPYVPGFSPPFQQHFAARWIRGGVPFSGSQERSIVVELGVRDSGAANETHLVALADFIPPIALSMLHGMAAGSSVTWMLELLTQKVEGLPLGGYRVDAELMAAEDGYTSQSAVLWGPHGQALALSRQTMVVFG